MLLINRISIVTFEAKCAEYLKMDKLLRYLFLLFNLKYLFALANAEQEHLQQKFTSKCDDLCTEQNENGTKVFFFVMHNTYTPFFAISLNDIWLIFPIVSLVVWFVQELGKLECLRGCQYFNIEFLVNARNKDKVVDLNQLVERCGACKLLSLHYVRPSRPMWKISFFVFILFLFYFLSV